MHIDRMYHVDHIYHDIGHAILLGTPQTSLTIINKLKTNMEDTLLDAPILAVSALVEYLKKKKKLMIPMNHEIRSLCLDVFGPNKQRRVRRSVAHVYNQLGPTYFWRAHRMKYESFSK